MDHSHVSEQLRRQTLRFKKLIEANQALARVESLDELLSNLLELAQDVTNTEGASILLYNEHRQILEFSLARNEFESAASKILDTNIELKVGEGIAGSVAQSKSSLIVNDTHADIRFSCRADDVTGFVTRNLLCSPILYKGKLLGVVQVLNVKGKDGFDPEDQDLLESFANLAAVALERARMLKSLLEQERMQTQLEAAARIQEHFLPVLPEFGNGNYIWASTRPAIMVGGDFYDCITLKDDSYLVCIADVSGKGLPAALVCSALWARLRSLADAEHDPGEVLAMLNHQMYDVLAQELFATVALCRFWPSTGRVQIASAAHPPALWVGADGIKELDEDIGVPIGVEPDAGYSLLELGLATGDSLLLYTDGVTEARNRKRSFYGEQRLMELLRSKPGPPWGAAIIESVDGFRDGMAANDDITIVEIWRS